MCVDDFARPLVDSRIAHLTKSFQHGKPTLPNGQRLSRKEGKVLRYYYIGAVQSRVVYRGVRSIENLNIKRTKEFGGVDFEQVEWCIIINALDKMVSTLLCPWRWFELLFTPPCGLTLMESNAVALVLKGVTPRL